MADVTALRHSSARYISLAEAHLLCPQCALPVSCLRPCGEKSRARHTGDQRRRVATGRCVGTAAAALGCVINALPSRPDSQAVPPAALLDQALSAMGAAAENAPRLSQSASARTGTALGLAALLGAPHMAPHGAGGDTWLLTRPECAGQAKQALEVRFPATCR